MMEGFKLKYKAVLTVLFEFCIKFIYESINLYSKSPKIFQEFSFT